VRSGQGRDRTAGTTILRSAKWLELAIQGDSKLSGAANGPEFSGIGMACHGLGMSVEGTSAAAARA
jgi:hypothetical protein